MGTWLWTSGRKCFILDILGFIKSGWTFNNIMIWFSSKKFSNGPNIGLILVLPLTQNKKTNRIFLSEICLHTDQTSFVYTNSLNFARCTLKTQKKKCMFVSLLLCDHIGLWAAHAAKNLAPTTYFEFFLFALSLFDPCGQFENHT